MRGIVLLLAASLVLVGCEAHADKLRRQYEMINGQLDKDAKCQKSREIADLYLRAEDQRQYGLWRAIAYNDCLRL